MNLEVVSKLIHMMEESSLTVMEVEQNGLRVHLENGMQVKEDAAIKSAVASCTSQEKAYDVHAVEITKTVQETEENDGRPVGGEQIVSPMVGTFHEIKDGKVRPGVKLAKGDPVCVIEAMKVMNEILMENDGEITWVAVSEGEMVEYGQVLFLFK